MQELALLRRVLEYNAVELKGSPATKAKPPWRASYVVPLYGEVPTKTPHNEAADTSGKIAALQRSVAQSESNMQTYYSNMQSAYPKMPADPADFMRMLANNDNEQLSKMASHLKRPPSWPGCPATCTRCWMSTRLRREGRERLSPHELQQMAARMGIPQDAVAEVGRLAAERSKLHTRPHAASASTTSSNKPVRDTSAQMLATSLGLPQDVAASMSTMSADAKVANRPAATRGVEGGSVVLSSGANVMAACTGCFCGAVAISDA
eukprot:jgi/Chlat1/5978/Chrsp4S06296